ncbi:MAG: glycosyltransferase [Sedimentisphaerales bacterium]|nr:glycosyltransferase [Sedimentisphaerales bacterium]
MSPIKHYVRHGWKEGRNPNQFFNNKWYLNVYHDVAASGMIPLYHYFKFGWHERRNPSPDFSTNQYLLLNPEVLEEKINPLAHWLKSGQVKNYKECAWSYRISEEQLLHKVRVYNLQKNQRKAKVVVYTAIIGNYDPLIIPEYITNDWDYVCFTDTEIPGEHIFEIRKTDYHHSDPARIARYIKTHPHLYFSEYDYSIWVDSSIMIRGPHLENSIKQCINRKVLLMCNPHPHRDCIYDELKKCITLNKDDKAVMEAQVERYKNEGFPEKSGLLETGLLIRKHNEEKVKAFNEIWWNEIENGSRRDQLSVMYALWKNKLPYETLQNMKDIRLYDNNDYYLFLHNHKRDRHTLAYTQPSFMWKLTSSQENQIIKKVFSSDEINNLKSERVDIVICVHNAIEDVKICIESVLKSLLPAHRIILVDDGSETITQEYLQNIAQEWSKQVILIRHDTAKGYTVSANDGLKASDASFVILLNSDTIVTENWTLKLLQTIQSDPKIGIVGPLSNAASWQSVPLIIDNQTGQLCINELPENMNVEDMNLICEQQGYLNQFPKVSLINGFCYGIKRDVINSIGYLDEESFPSGYGEEDDFSLRAGNAGFSCAIATHCYIYHAKSKSFGKKNRDKLARAGGETLSKLHGQKRIQKAVKETIQNPLVNQVRSYIKDLYNGNVEQKQIETSINNERHYSESIISVNNKVTNPKNFPCKGLIISKDQIADMEKFTTFINQNNIEFFDFGCSKGDGLLWTQNLLSKIGMGFDIDNKKLELASKKGGICTDCDILNLKKVKMVSFTTMYHLLEHLESTRQAKEFILKACDVSRQNIYIRQPYFDADPWLFHKGLKTYYSHWTGHRNLMTTPVLYHLFMDLLAHGIIKDFIIAYKGLIEWSNSEMIHSLTSPIDSLQYDKAKHPSKPAKIFFNEIPVYFEIIVCVDINGEGYGKLWPLFKPDKVVFDSRLMSSEDKIKLVKNPVCFHENKVINSEKINIHSVPKSQNNTQLDSQNILKKKGFQKKILLVNDTGQSTNLGCKIVSKVFYDLFGSSNQKSAICDNIPLGYLSEYFRDIAIKPKDCMTQQNSDFPSYLPYAPSVPFDTWEFKAESIKSTDLDLCERIKSCDAILVNGEGTIHHNFMRGLSLLAIMKTAIDLSRPVLLFNATVQAIEPRILESIIPKLEFVHAREMRTFGELKKFNRNIFCAPDIAFLSKQKSSLESKTFPNAKDYCLITAGILAKAELIQGLFDNVKRKGLKPLYLCISDSEEEMLASKWGSENNLDMIKAWEIPAEEIVSFMSQFPMAISGRHHMNICLMAAGVPFIPMPSNTWKVEETLSLVEYPIAVVHHQAEMNEKLDYILNNRDSLAMKCLESFNIGKKMTEELIKRVEACGY